jgi:hypothetical protein
MTFQAAPSFEQSALALAWVTILLLAFAMSGLLRQVHAILRAIQGGRSLMAGPATGLVAPRLPQLNGARQSVLLFVEHSCPSCREAIQALAHAEAKVPDDRTYLVLYRGPAPEVAADSSQLTVVPNASSAFDAMNIAVTPTAVVLDERRRVVTSAAVGSQSTMEEFIAYVGQGSGMK